MADFLKQRGHEIAYFAPLEGTATYNFEHRIAILKECDWLIYEASRGNFDEGFIVALAISKLLKKTLFVYNETNAKLVPETVNGCTHSHCYIKTYKVWQDLQNILTLLRF